MFINIGLNQEYRCSIGVNETVLKIERIACELCFDSVFKYIKEDEYKMKGLSKRLVVVILVVSMLISFAACTAKKPEAEPDKPAEKTIALIVPATIGDPFIALSIKGLEKLAAEQGAQLKVVESLEKSEHEMQVKALADLGANPIYTMWTDLSTAAINLAPSYPNTTFIMCDVFFDEDKVPALGNLSQVTVDPTESAFLAGVVAVSKTSTGKVGFIAHADRPESRPYRGGYTKGVEYASNGNVQVEVSYVGSDQDPVKGQEIAKLLIQNNNVDVVFQAASMSGLGVIKACEELKIPCIGADDWMGDVGNTVFWSALKKFDDALYLEGKSVFDNTYKGGFKSYGLATGLEMYDERDFNNLPKDVQEKVLEAVEGIKSGKIKVLDN